MRYETCLICRVEGIAPEEPQQHAMTVAAEMLSGLTHHHHVVECEGCGAWWFADVVTGALGLPAEAHRDTVLCPCDENLPQYPRSTVWVPEPEERCRCDKAQIESYRGLRIKTGRP